MMSRRALVLCSIVVALGCDGATLPNDASTADRPPQCETASAFEAARGDGVASPLEIAPGEVRAGRLTEAQLPADPDGLARWREGDFVLANERVGVIVSDVGPGELYDPYGGRIVGLATMQDGALVDPADYNLFLLGMGRFLVATESVGVIADGSNGQAVVRATGTLAPIRALADLLDLLLPDDHGGLPAALDYELAGGSDALDIFLSVRAGPRAARARSGTLIAFFQAYRMPAWAPGTGFRDRSGSLPYLAFEDEDGTSYAWTVPDGTVEPLFGTSGIDVLTSSAFTVPPCGEVRRHVGRVVIGRTGLPGVQAAVARASGTSLRSLVGEALEADGSPARDVRLHVTTADGEHLTRLRPTSDGSFEVEVDPRAAQLWAFREGELVGPVAIGAGEARITMGEVGAIEVAVTDEDGGGLPARVEVVPLDGPLPLPPEAFGEPRFGSGRSRIAFPVDGRATLRVPVGRHRVSVSRGPEYERRQFELDVAAGGAVPLDVTLARVVDTTGVMCADYHIHTHRSVDSSDSARLKVTGLVADGLEIAIRSEHEWVSDFAPVVEALGLGDYAFGMAGLELTTFTYGHFGVFPLTPDPARASGGAISWYDLVAPDVFDLVRARTERPALIVNHPRASGLRQGYFSEAGYDPDTGSVARPELWDEELRVVEVFNDSDFERNRNASVRDWFSLLSSGRQVFAVGSSDSHRVYGAPVGYPRTCLYLGVDDPRAVSATMVRDATVAGRGYVSGGIYLDVSGPGGVGPGEEATSVGSRTAIDVVVRAAPWVDVSRIELIVDGTTVTTFLVREDDGDPLEPTVRARATLDVDVAASGSWVLVHVAGDEPIDASGHRPFAVSNPIFLRR